MTVFETRRVGLVTYWVISICDEFGRVLVMAMDVIFERCLKTANDGLSEALFEMCQVEF